MTLLQFIKLTDRYKERLKREDRRAGEVVAILFNVNRGEKTETLDWTDVFPEWKEETEQTEDEMLLAMQAWAAATKSLPS